MSKAMHLDQSIIGKEFFILDPNVKYKCVGYAQNETFLVFGASNDVPNNRFTIKSVKVSEVTFIGQA